MPVNLSLPHDTRFVVHIGRHKTGTSSLQRALHTQTELLARLGYLYPHAGRDPKGLGQSTMVGHHRLAYELRNGTVGPIASELIAETKGEPGVVIVSSEAAQNIAPTNLSLVFPVEQTAIVVYLREQVSYLLSGYAQRVQAKRYFAPLSDYIEERLDELNYVPRLEALVDTYGADRVIARPYDPAYLVGGNTVTDFYSILGIDVEPPSDDGNPSINANTILVKRLLNILDSSMTESDYQALPALSELLGGYDSLAMSPLLQTRIREIYAEANRILFERYIGIPEGAFTLKDYSRDDSRYTQDELIGLLEVALRELGKRVDLN